jgi:hypothetical protein
MWRISQWAQLLVNAEIFHGVSTMGVNLCSFQYYKKDELSVTFVSLKIIVYLIILGVNLSSWFEILGEVNLQVRYKPSVIWGLN